MSVRKYKRPETKGKEASKEMLGDPRPYEQLGEKVNPKWRKHLSRLLDLRDQLLKQKRAQLRDVVEESPSFSMHMADAGTDSYDRDLALGMLSHEQDAVYEIEQALKRIRDGTYGVCEITGKQIPLARLKAIPWTRFTAEAEKTLEKKGQFQRAQLGSRETVVKESTPREPE
jgi:RNA polymerase-binding transcription factor DksA